MYFNVVGCSGVISSTAILDATKAPPDTHTTHARSHSAIPLVFSAPLHPENNFLLSPDSSISHFLMPG